MSRDYFNRKAAVWDETVAEKDIGRLEQMAERLGIAPGVSVLDIGTGTGVFVPCIMKRIGRQGKLVCLDCAEVMLQRARAKGFDGDIDYLHGDVMNIPLSARVFDSVICYSSFPHFLDKVKALSEIARVLKKDGRLYICHTRSRARVNVIHLQIPVLEKDLIPEVGELRTMLAVTGFGQVYISDESDSFLVSAVKLERRS